MRQPNLGSLLLLLLCSASVHAAAYVRGVPCFSQARNRVDPGGSCQNTCMAMVLKYYGAEDVTPDALSRRWGTSKAQTVSGWQEMFNIEASERGVHVRDVGVSAGRLSAVYRQLDAGFPVVVHGAFTRSGHLIVLVGYDSLYVYVNDPAGDWQRGYGDAAPSRGCQARYERRAVESVLAGGLTGDVRFHALRAEPGVPVVAVEHCWPDSAVAGSTVQVKLTVRVQNRDGSVTGVTADLRALGGSRVRLQPLGDGRHGGHFRLDLRDLDPGRYEIVLGAGPTDAMRFSGRRLWFTVTSARSAAVFSEDGDNGWVATLVQRAELRSVSAPLVYAGARALAVKANTFQLRWQTQAPLNPVGYRALRLAFHPGGVEGNSRSALSLYINDDIRTLVKLLGDDGTPAVDLSRREWQVVEIPLRLLAWSEAPIRSLHLFGNLVGSFYLDEIEWVRAVPCPLLAAWERAPDDSLVAGSQRLLRASVRLQARAEDGTVPVLSADLSAVGGACAVPLTSLDGELYVLTAPVRVGSTNGVGFIRVHMEQRQGDTIYRRVLAHRVVITAAAAAPVYGDAWDPRWTVVPSATVSLEEHAQAQVATGTWSLGVHAANFTVDCFAHPPLNPIGYAALALRFHPGTATTSARQPAFTVFVNGDARTAVRLLGSQAVAPGLHLDAPRWQSVRIPLQAFGDFDGPITSLRFLGNLQGTFYLDDIRWVAAAPAAQPTAVVTTGQPRFVPGALETNYPNPFNGSTRIRFSLTRRAPVELRVYDLLGQQLTRLFSGTLPRGEHELQWDGADAHGGLAASGVYVLQLRMGVQTYQRRMLLLR